MQMYLFLLCPVKSQFLVLISDDAGGGGYFRQNSAWMCLPNLENLTLSIPIFRQLPTH